MRILLAPTTPEIKEVQPTVVLAMPTDYLSPYEAIDMFHDALLAYGFPQGAVKDAFLKFADNLEPLDILMEFDGDGPLDN
jgi:hypothetical protein